MGTVDVNFLHDGKFDAVNLPHLLRDVDRRRRFLAPELIAGKGQDRQLIKLGLEVTQATVMAVGIASLRRDVG